MIHHRMKRNDFRLGDGAMVTIEHWTDANKVHVAAFGIDGHQASVATYEASVDGNGSMKPEVHDWLVDSLANALEYDLINHPEISVRLH